jgi:hypothetical protein
MPSINAKGYSSCTVFNQRHTAPRLAQISDEVSALQDLISFEQRRYWPLSFVSTNATLTIKNLTCKPAPRVLAYALGIDALVYKTQSTRPQYKL